MQEVMVLRLTYRRTAVYGMWPVMLAAILSVIWPPTELWKYVGMALISAGFAAVWIRYVRVTKVVVDATHVRVYDTVWPDQAMPRSDIMGLRKVDGYWELAGRDPRQKLKLRPLYNKAEVAQLRSVLRI
ncbi:hypothetical protein [Catellatospora sichuanensis]|uniref:hypothetical protein n=1 Tax=Catellatospora sichuanensis TaxID=1969805 RepID=UPI0011843249|nr:hypothetical protein [Catellatospora sichuanensis]